MDVDDCRRLLAACLPALTLREVRYLAEGWDSTVFEVNGDLVFRFPKRHAVAQALVREVRLLAELGPHLPAPVPGFTYVVSDCAESALPFGGYPKLPGIPLDAAVLGRAQLGTLARQLGACLAALHSFPVSRAAALGMPPSHVAGGPAAFRAFAALVQERAGPLLTAGERQCLASWFRRAADGRIFDFIPALAHNDLSAEHILVNPETGALSGVIDFGDAGIGDPAIDFTGLLHHPGAPFTRMVLAACGRPDDEAMLRRAALYGELSPLHEIVFGLEVADAAHVAHGLARLRAGLLAS